MKSQLNANKTYLKELKNINGNKTQKMMEKVYKSVLDGLRKSKVEIEAQIALVIKSNQSIKANYNFLISVPGIEPLIATYILCCTNNFAKKPTKSN